MNSNDKLKRLIMIIRRAKERKAFTMREMQYYLESNAYLFENDTFKFSRSTFNRDIDAIEKIFRIQIEFNHNLKYYTITHDESDVIAKRMIEAFDIFNALEFKEHLNDCIHIEERRPSGTEYLHSLIKAAKEQKEVRFQYAKFGTNELTQRTIQPYGIKEFRNWWFLLGKEHESGILKSFGFDRIRNLEITGNKFEKDPDFDIQKYYQHAFGATVLENKQPQEIILSITGEEMNYVKAMPFHASQEILEDTPERLLIKLEVYITWELVAELRGKIPYIEIVSPKELKENLLSFKYFDQF